MLDEEMVRKRNGYTFWVESLEGRVDGRIILKWILRN
jgi:hypothetical protein